MSHAHEKYLGQPRRPCFFRYRLVGQIRYLVLFRFRSGWFSQSPVEYFSGFHLFNNIFIIKNLCYCLLVRVCVCILIYMISSCKYVYFSFKDRFWIYFKLTLYRNRFKNVCKSSNIPFKTLII